MPEGVADEYHCIGCGVAGHCPLLCHHGLITQLLCQVWVKRLSPLDRGGQSGRLTALQKQRSGRKSKGCHIWGDLGWATRPKRRETLPLANEPCTGSREAKMGKCWQDPGHVPR